MIQEKGMSLIVKTVTKLTFGLIIFYGIYITLIGHISPGGGFAGGVIIALAFIHIMLAFGKEVALKRLRSNVLRPLISAAALVFLFIVITGFPGKHISAYLIPLCEMVIVGFGLFSIFTALVLLSKPDKDAE